MRTVLRDLESVSGVRCGCIVRDGEVLASTFIGDSAATLAASRELVGAIAEGLELLGRELDEVLLDLGEASVVVVPVEEGFTLTLLAGAETNLDLLRVVMQSSVRQIRMMLSRAPQVSASSVSTKQPDTSDEDVERLFPKIIELLTVSIGPAARVVFKHGVSMWKASHTPTVGNLVSLVEILSVDLASDEDRLWFCQEVERLHTG